MYAVPAPDPMRSQSSDTSAIDWGREQYYNTSWLCDRLAAVDSLWPGGSGDVTVFCRELGARIDREQPIASLYEVAVEAVILVGDLFSGKLSSAVDDPESIAASLPEVLGKIVETRDLRWLGGMFEELMLA